MVLPGDDCGDCTPSYLGPQRRAPVAIVFSSLPFFVTFLFVATVVFQRLFPLLSGDFAFKGTQNGSSFAPLASISRSSSSRSGNGEPGNPIKRISALAFSTTIALAAVLAELVLCEISDSLDPVARGLALRFTVLLLLFLLIVVIPSLEIHSVISAAGWKYVGREAGRLKLAWALHATFFGLWLAGFWWSGRVMLAEHHKEAGLQDDQGVINTTTEHVGVIGISLMALLSGFASVSAPWQSFFARAKPVSDTTIARKQAGLDSTNEMLAAKRSRLRALQRKMSDAAPEGFFKKAMGTFRSNIDAAEKKTLEMEVSGLENMALALSTHHALLSSRHSQQRRAKTPLGRVLRGASYFFSSYCLYRILATTLTFARRRLAPPDQPFVGSDPINNILGLLVRHYDAALDRQAWARQISFLLSGVMLLASLSSVLQTFHFLARFAPALLRAARRNLALVVAQTCATYVISVALLLRGIMPVQVVGERLHGLGGGDMRWVDGWFEAWFLAGVVVTVGGVWIGAKIRGIEEWDDEDDDVEMGKLS